jgi:hypothetical protein
MPKIKKSYQNIFSKWEFFIKKPTALIRMYAPQLSLLQAKLFNIFIYMIEHGERFHIEQNNTLPTKIISEIKNNFSDDNAQIYFIPLNYMHDLLNENHTIDKIKEAVRIISNINIEINFDKYENPEDKPKKECNIESVENHFVVSRLITKNIGDYLAIQFNQKFINILKNNKKCFTYFKIVVMNNFSSLYAMKIYEHIFNKYHQGQDIINNNNRSFISLGALHDDYAYKKEILNKTLDNYKFFNLAKIKNDNVIKEIRELTKIINMNYDNLTYNIGQLKYLFDHTILPEINNKFKDGLKDLLVNKELQQRIKNYQNSKHSDKNLLVGWIWPEIIIRPIWLIRSKLHGAKDPRKICHVLFQFYRIVDIDIDKLLQYTAEDIDKLNFHIPIK